MNVPLESSRVTRVAYRRGLLLDDADFRLEQDAQRLSLERHLRAAHDWGVLEGLELVWREERVVLTAGLAVDRCGRTLALVADQVLDDPLLDTLAKQAGAALVVVRLVERRVGLGRDGSSPAEWLREDVEVRLLPVARSASDTPDERSVLPAHASAPPPGGPLGDVPLGIVSSLGEPGTWTLRAGPRRAAGLVAAHLLSPSGRVRLDLDDTAAALAVAIDDVPALSLAHDGTLHVRTSVELGAALDVERLVLGPGSVPAPTAGANRDDESVAIERRGDDLVIRLPRNGRFVVGAFDASGERQIEFVVPPESVPPASHDPGGSTGSGFAAWWKKTGQVVVLPLVTTLIQILLVVLLVQLVLK